MGNWREKLALSPASIMLLTLLFIALTQWAAVSTLLQQPWTGIRVEPDTSTGFLRVVSVAPNSPAAKSIQPGSILKELKLASQSVELGSKLFLYPFHHANRFVYDHYQQQQITIHSFLTSGQLVSFVDNHGKEYAVVPEKTTRWQYIPWSFWVFSSFFVFVPLLGAGIWSYKPEPQITITLFIVSIGCYVFHGIGLLNSAKEFFFGRKETEFLFLLELISINVYMLAMYRLGFSYPYRLVNSGLFLAFTVVFIFYSVNFYFHWFALPAYFLVFHNLIQFVVIVLANYTQLKRCSANPVGKMAVRVIQLSMIVPFVVVVIFYIVPVVLGLGAWISKDFIQLLGALAFFGFAMGILRFRLFEVEYWWFKSWLWLLGGCVVVLMDMLLIGLLNTPQLYALGLSVMLTGFLYFPLRQWLLGKLIPLESQALQDFLPQFGVSLAQADSPQAFEQSWKAVLEARFSPQNIARQAAPVTQPELVDNGLGLRVPALADGEVLHLTGKHMAARLFNKADIKAVAALLDIARMAHKASDAREQAVREERERLLHELNATVGNKLSKLADDLTDPLGRQATEDALHTLESTVRLTLRTEPLALSACLSIWQAEIGQRAALAGVQLDWQVKGEHEDDVLQPSQAFELALFLHEAVSNALKHAHPSRLSVHFAAQTGCLQISVGNDGAVSSPDGWRAGTGMVGMTKRIQHLQGSLQPRYLEQQGWVWLDAVMPLKLGAMP